MTKRWAEMRSPGREPQDALAYAAKAAYPIFCKPLSASNGLFAEVIDSAEEFADYMARVSREHFDILIQPYVRAAEYRVFVLNQTPLFSYHKTLPSVWGDGERTLAELVAALPCGREAPRARGRDQRDKKIDADDVVEKKMLVLLEGPANRAAGGGANDLRDGAPRKLGEIALAATKAVSGNTHATSTSASTRLLPPGDHRDTHWP